MYPKLFINLKVIGENYLKIKKECETSRIELIPVVKVVRGDRNIVRTLHSLGANVIADSRIKNIIDYKDIKVKKLLLRSPSFSEIDSVVELTDYSLETEMVTIEKIASSCKKNGKKHGVIVMVEVGELREGLMPEDVVPFVKKITSFSNIEFLGLGTNTTCFSGIIPDNKNLKVLYDLKLKIEEEGIKVKILSGGGTNLLRMIWDRKIPDFINQIRVGEGIFLGVDAIKREPLSGLRQDTFRLDAELIEVKKKPSLPWGEKTKDAFEEEVEFKDEGIMIRGIASIGRQDIILSGIKEDESIKIIGASSDHMVLNLNKSPSLKVGDIISFRLNYAGVLSSFTSPYVEKIYIEE
ncbi:MAG TPA: alanine racemase [Caldisericia bacterium]|nr:alanine racemase [Caldisericia bacterium]HQL66255.1 alanine racemase [Caldisericia bacterium]HQN48122.1 alanine racemase [Caldisericia bacterium]HQP00361.1 alanine racemase [Caldisericia bacterium]